MCMCIHKYLHRDNVTGERGYDPSLHPYLAAYNQFKTVESRLGHYFTLPYGNEPAAGGQAPHHITFSSPKPPFLSE